MFFLVSTEGSLVDTRAYLALHLGGTPSQETSTSPPSCQLLDNRLYIYVMFYLLKLYPKISRAPILFIMQKTFTKFDKEFKLQISWITFKIAFFLTRVKAKLFDKNIVNKSIEWGVVV